MKTTNGRVTVATEDRGANLAPHHDAGSAVQTGLALAVTIVGLTPVYLTGAFFVQIRRPLEISGDGLGIAIAGFFMGAALTSSYAGSLVSRFGTVRVIRAATALSGLVLICEATLVHGSAALTAALFAGGVGLGVSQPATNQFLSEGPASHQGLAFGVKQAAAPLAILVSGLAVLALGITVGWRWAFAGFGMGILLGTAIPGATARGSPTLSERSGIHLPSMLIITAAAALGSSAGSALGSFVVTGAVQAGYSLAIAGMLAALGSAIGAVVRIYVGHRADRRASSDLLVVAMMLCGGVVGFVLLATSMPVLFAAGVAIAFGAGWGWAGLFNLAVVRAYPHSAAKATGVSQIGAYMGGMLGPASFGILASHLSFHAAWLLAAAAAGCGAVGMVIGARHLSALRAHVPAQVELEN